MLQEEKEEMDERGVHKASRKLPREGIIDTRVLAAPLYDT